MFKNEEYNPDDILREEFEDDTLEEPQESLDEIDFENRQNNRDYGMDNDNEMWE